MFSVAGNEEALKTDVSLVPN